MVRQIMLTETDKAQILDSIKAWSEWNDGLRPSLPAPIANPEAIEQFMRSNLGVNLIDKTFPVQWGQSFRWTIFFDTQGKVTAPDAPAVPFEQRIARTALRVVVSRVGPYMTVKRLTLTVGEEGTRECRFRAAPIDGEALRWAEAIAVRFGLKYLDEDELRAWKISLEFTDAVEIFLEDSDPDGFNLLFYEF